jgi:ATP-dependent Clp protease adaptor protein ClpS
MKATGTETATRAEEKLLTEAPWSVVVLNDPVNLVDYVVWAFMKVLGYPKARATLLTLEAHQNGRCVVWSGEREQAEFFAQQLQALQLSAFIEKPE